MKKWVQKVVVWSGAEKGRFQIYIYLASKSFFNRFGITVIFGGFLDHKHKWEGPIFSDNEPDLPTTL